MAAGPVDSFEFTPSASLWVDLDAATNSSQAPELTVDPWFLVHHPELETTRNKGGACRTSMAACSGAAKENMIPLLASSQPRDVSEKSMTDNATIGEKGRFQAARRKSSEAVLADSPCKKKSMYTAPVREAKKKPQAEVKPRDMKAELERFRLQKKDKASAGKQKIFKGKPP